MCQMEVLQTCSKINSLLYNFLLLPSSPPHLTGAPSTGAVPGETEATVGPVGRKPSKEGEEAQGVGECQGWVC